MGEKYFTGWRGTTYNQKFKINLLWIIEVRVLVDHLDLSEHLFFVFLLHE